jgi:putative ABC transport system permease protein
MHDLRAALRAIARKPGFAALAIATLAIGIGGNTAILSIIDRVLLQPLPYPHADRLVMPWEFSADIQQRLGFDRLPSSPGDVTDFRTRNRSFEHLAWVRADRVNLTGTGDPERIGAVRVSRNFFDVLGVSPAIGRGFTDDDLRGDRVVLIADTLWRRRFGSDADVVGRTISLNGSPATVVGVLPRWFGFPRAGDLPAGFGFSTDPEIWTLDVLTPAMERSRAAKSFALIGRLRSDVSPEAAEADLAAIAAAIAREFPASNAGWTVRVLPLREQLVGGLRPSLVVLLIAVGVVLLIACANVANLMLVRAAGRQRELCVRLALGSGAARLVRQLLLESLVLALLAGAVGSLMAWMAMRALVAVSPASLASISRFTLDWRALAYTLGLSVLAGLAFGLLPALHAARTDLVSGLRDGGRGTVGGRRAHRTRSALVIGEVALAMVLLVGAVLLVQTFVRLLGVNAGFRGDGVLTMEVALPRLSYPGSRAADFFDRLTSRLRQVPGITDVAVTSSLPLGGGENLRQITVESRPRPAPGQEVIGDYRIVTPHYFAVMGIPLVTGEILPEVVSADGQPVLLVNETMARTVWPGENALGRRIKLTSFDEPGPWMTIVGIVGDTRHTALESSPRPQVYVQQRADPSQQMVIVMRTAADPAGFAAVARAAVLEIDRDQPVGRVRTMRAVIAESVSQRRFMMALVGSFAVLALGLSLVGLYAVISHSVAERTQEIGVRLALGAQPADMLRLVLSEGWSLVGMGVAIGLAAALVLTRFIQAMLFGVQAHDLTTFVLVPLLLFAAATVGCLVPAIRAMRVDPVIALRSE